MKKQLIAACFVLSLFVGTASITAARGNDQGGESKLKNLKENLDTSAITDRIKGLMEQIKKLQEQVRGNQGKKNDSAATSTKEYGFKDVKVCKNIPQGGRFGRGMKGEGVKGIQAFLKDEGELEDDSVTGFFGEKTERALGKWQAKHGVVATGTTVTTGMGMFGDKTRASMLRRCNDQSINHGTTSTTTAQAFKLSPAKGKAPLTVEVMGLPAAVMTKVNGCIYGTSTIGTSGNGLSVDWGDGALEPKLGTNTVGTSCTNSVKKHTYTKAGTFTVKVKSWHLSSTSAVVSDWEGSTKVVVSASSTTTTGTTAATSTKAAKAAKAALVDKLDVAPSSVTIISAVTMTWTNGCLDLTTLGSVCTQALVPGYKVTLKQGTTLYYAHTNKTGSVVGFE
jgi:peptidoglycan hydrolase-like protein with peptidoglycan-binding domain